MGLRRALHLCDGGGSGGAPHSGPRRQMTTWPPPRRDRSRLPLPRLPLGSSAPRERRTRARRAPASRRVRADDCQRVGKAVELRKGRLGRESVLLGRDLVCARGRRGATTHIVRVVVGRQPLRIARNPHLRAVGRGLEDGGVRRTSMPHPRAAGGRIARWSPRASVNAPVN